LRKTVGSAPGLFSIYSTIYSASMSGTHKTLSKCFGSNCGIRVPRFSAFFYLWIRDPEWDKTGSGTQDEHPRSFRKLRNSFGLKIFKFFMRISSTLDSVSGIQDGKIWIQYPV
jgi:hypothetical protein